MKRLIRLLALLTCFLSGLALAHKPSDAYLSLTVSEAGRGALQGRWDVALRDLDNALGLDTDENGLLTWGEVRPRLPELNRYLLAHLTIESRSRPCPLSISADQIESHSDGHYLSVALRGDCTAPHAITLRYSLFADLDAQHRAILRLQDRGGVRSALVTPNQPATFELNTTQTGSDLLSFVREGVRHIWSGIDHLLFLLSLLLPSVLRREDGRWVPVRDLRTALGGVLKVVTAFTLAHSITLTLAATGVLHLPARLTESAIALSVVLAALNNLRPVLPERRLWLVAFGFGLIHGFGFASALADLELPRAALLPALLGFNLGVELGQLAVVAAFVPLAFLARAQRAYTRFTLAGGSLVVALVASVWLAERVFDFKLLPI